MGTSDLHPDQPVGPRQAGARELQRVGARLADIAAEMIARPVAPPPQPPDPAQELIARRRAALIESQRGPMWTDDNPGEVGK